MTHKKTATRMIAQDLRDRGFGVVSAPSQGKCTAYLKRQTVTVATVTVAMIRAGYDEAQFSAQQIGDRVVVKPII